MHKVHLRTASGRSVFYCGFVLIKPRVERASACQARACTEAEGFIHSEESLFLLCKRAALFHTVNLSTCATSTAVQPQKQPRTSFRPLSSTLGCLRGREYTKLTFSPRIAGGPIKPPQEEFQEERRNRGRHQTTCIYLSDSKTGFGRCRTA